MIIGIGSKNPVKIAAVQAVVKQIWPDVEVVSFDAPSGVSEQPRSDEEAVQGCRNRAKFVLEDDPDVDIAIGHEAAVVEFEDRLYCTGWAVALDRFNKEGLGCGGKFPLPHVVAAEVKNGKELGPAMDGIQNDHNTKQKHGAVGFLTKGVIDRTSAVQREMTYALIPFISGEFY